MVARQILQALDFIHSKGHSHGTLDLDCIHLEGVDLDKKSFTEI